MAINLPAFPSFELIPRETIPNRFQKYVKRLQTLFAAMQIDDPAHRQAMLLHYVGEEVPDIFDILVLPPATSNGPNLFARSSTALKDQKCVDHHVYLFRKECHCASKETIQHDKRKHTI